MAYVAPDLAALRTAVLRDLRDANGEAFQTEQIDDFINSGIGELNDARPLEARVEYTNEDDLTTGLPFVYVWLLEAYIQLADDSPASWGPVAPESGVQQYGRNGWLYYAHGFQFSPQIQEGINQAATRYGDDHVHFAVWGYTNRDALAAPTDVAGFEDLMQEQLVRRWARLEGYRALNTDFALFQQWTAQAQNAGISPTQLQNDVGIFESEFNRVRKRLFRIRRPQVGG